MKDVEKYSVNVKLPYGKAYCVKHPRTQAKLNIIASIDDGWEHVSVTLEKRTPTWDEMHFIKTVFFEDEEICLQFHPKKSQYVNVHKNCLHIWKPPEHIARILQI